MRKPNEIKKGLECLVRGKYPNAYCGGCSYHENAAQYLYECKSPEIITDTLAYIQQLESERDALLADLKEADMIDCCHCKSYIHSENNACEAADFNCDACEKKRLHMQGLPE